MVTTDRDGRIRSFHEKPGRSDIYSDLINTGVYILEPEILKYIPEGCSFDFGRDLFPALAQQNAPLYGFVAQGYWCDVGDVNAYLQVHTDALDGKIRLEGLNPLLQPPLKNPSFDLETPTYISPSARIEDGAHIGAYSVIGDNCFVASGASIKRSVLLSGARIGGNAQLRGCVIGTNAVIGEAAQLFEESVVGSRSLVGERATLPSGVKLWPEKRLAGGERADANIIWGSQRTQRFVTGALLLESPSQAVRAVEACTAVLRPRELVLGRSVGCVADAMWHAATAGAMAQGAQVIDAGTCSLSQLRYTLASLHADAAMWVETDRFTPLNSLGARLTERMQRDILKLMERQDFSGPFSALTRPVLYENNMRTACIADTAAVFTANPLYAPEIVLHAPEALLEDAFAVFDRAGLRVRCEESSEAASLAAGEIGVNLSGNGETALLRDVHGSFDEIQRQLALAWIFLERGDRQLILPIHATRAIERLAECYGAHALYIPGEEAVWMNAAAERAPIQFNFACDGLRFALSFLSLLTDKGLSLKQWRKKMPAACRSVRRISIPASESGHLLHSLAQRVPEAELGGGVRLPREKGWAWLSPDEEGGLLDVVAEAADMESARELCDFYGSEIDRLLQRRD